MKSGEVWEIRKGKESSFGDATLLVQIKRIDNDTVHYNWIRPDDSETVYSENQWSRKAFLEHFVKKYDHWSNK